MGASSCPRIGADFLPARERGLPSTPLSGRLKFLFAWVSYDGNVTGKSFLLEYGELPSTTTPDQRFPPPPWGMIADDLTGACDSGVQFAQNGFKTVLQRGTEWLKDSAADLIVVSTESRNDAPSLARRKVMDACRRMKDQDIQVIYKKIDSTLRGNEGAEIDAVVDACGFAEAVVTPAFPEMGRVVLRGRLKTAFGTTALNVRAQLSCSKPVRVIDAENPQDLDSAAADALARTPAPLLAGSAGLASHLAAALASRMDRVPARRRPPKTGKPVLFLMGSDQPPTCDQVDYIVGHGLANVLPLERSDIAALDRALAEQKHLVIRLAVYQTPRLILRERLSSWRPELLGAIVMSGGDTAEALCGVLQVAAIELESELQPGIPWGRLCGGPLGGTTLVTKAGSFGQPDSLASIGAALTRWRTRSAA